MKFTIYQDVSHPETIDTAYSGPALYDGGRRGEVMRYCAVRGDSTVHTVANPHRDSARSTTAIRRHLDRGLSILHREAWPDGRSGSQSRVALGKAPGREASDPGFMSTTQWSCAERPWARLRKGATMKRATFLATVCATAVIATPIVVLASHQFTDVPNSNIFHDDIAWIADRGVTKGCTPTEYCPKDFVTREQMAAFLHRLGANQVVDAGELEGLTAEEVVSQCPSGTTLFVSTCIETTTRPSAEWVVAAQTCALEQRRLPSTGELLGYRDLPGVTLVAEWTDDVADITNGLQIYVATDVGTGTIEDPFTPLPYRCVAGLG